MWEFQDCLTWFFPKGKWDGKEKGLGGLGKGKGRWEVRVLSNGITIKHKKLSHKIQNTAQIDILTTGWSKRVPDTFLVSKLSKNAAGALPRTPLQLTTLPWGMEEKRKWKGEATGRIKRKGREILGPPQKSILCQIRQCPWTLGANTPGPHLRACDTRSPCIPIS